MVLDDLKRKETKIYVKFLKTIPKQFSYNCILQRVVLYFATIF